MAKVIERAEKDGEVLVAVEFEAPIDVALDQLLRSPEKRGRTANSLAVVEVGDSVVEEVDVAAKRLKEEAHVSVGRSDVENASAGWNDFELGRKEAREDRNVVEAGIRIPAQIGDRLSDRAQTGPKTRFRSRELRHPHRFSFGACVTTARADLTRRVSDSR